jgi:hypothetical protein
METLGEGNLVSASVTQHKTCASYPAAHPNNAKALMIGAFSSQPVSGGMPLSLLGDAE